MSRTYRILYSPESLDDVRNIGAYIRDELGSPQAAKGLVSKIRDTIRNLSTMPLRHPVVGWEPWRSAGVRRVTVGNHTIFYLVDQDSREVRVLRVLYGRMDFEGIEASIE